MVGLRQRFINFVKKEELFQCENVKILRDSQQRLSIWCSSSSTVRTRYRKRCTTTCFLFARRCHQFFRLNFSAEEHQESEPNQYIHPMDIERSWPHNSLSYRLFNSTFTIFSVGFSPHFYIKSFSEKGTTNSKSEDKNVSTVEDRKICRDIIERKIILYRN